MVTAPKHNIWIPWSSAAPEMKGIQQERHVGRVLYFVYCCIGFVLGDCWICHKGICTAYMRTWVRSELGTIGPATFAIAGFPSREWDVHGIYYRKIKLQVAKESYISRKWKLFVRFVDKIETFPPKWMHLGLQTNSFLVHPQNGTKKFGTPWWCSTFLFYKKL